MTTFATTLHDRGHLRHDVTVDDARDTLWAYNSAELYQLLVIERGWTPDHYGQWIAAALTAASSDGTFPPSRHRSGGCRRVRRRRANPSPAVLKRVPNPEPPRPRPPGSRRDP